MKEGRIIGLDYGSKTVGVALSDPLLMTAQAVETIWRKEENKLRQTLARIEEIIKKEGVTLIVLGFPKNMNNTIGDRAQKTGEFAKALERRTGLKVVLWDERMSTMAAARTLMEGEVRRENRKTYVDQLAAVFILQGYLDYLAIHSGWLWRSMMSNQGKVEFTLTDTGEKEAFYIVEQTRINNINYILVADSKEDEAQALILKESYEGTDTSEAVYSIVDNDDELDAISKVFAQMVDDIDIELE